MDRYVTQLFLNNWPRKLIALLTAVIIWLFVNQSITITKVIPNVPIRIVNLPPDKTILGLQSNGYLSERVTLTLSGSKDAVGDLEPGDIEAVVDASKNDSNEWIVSINKNDLISLNPRIDPNRNIKSVRHGEFIIKLSKLITDQVPIYIKKPSGKGPEGYEYLEIWPASLKQTISGPEEEIRKIKAKGLQLFFNINAISKKELDRLTPKENNARSDEVSFLIPEKWKRISIPFQNFTTQKINDPGARQLRIDFLRTTMHPTERLLPIQIFFPPIYSEMLNTFTTSLMPTDVVAEKNHLFFLNRPLYIKGVSRLFLEVVRDDLVIVVTAAPKSERKILQWEVELINSKKLENLFVAFSLADHSSREKQDVPQKLEEMLRNRFQCYVQRMEFYITPTQKLNLRCHLEENRIKVELAN